MQSSTLRIRPRLLGLGVVPILMASMFGADEPTKTVDAGGLVFTVPSAWKSVPVSNAKGLGGAALPHATGGGEGSSQRHPLEDGTSAVALLQVVVHLLRAHVLCELVGYLSVRGLHGGQS